MSTRYSKMEKRAKRLRNAFAVAFVDAKGKQVTYKQLADDAERGARHFWNARDGQGRDRVRSGSNLIFGGGAE